MRKKSLLLLAIIAILTFGLAACASGNKESGKSGGSDGEKVTLHVAALEAAYGKDMWDKIAESYEKINKNVKIDLTVKKNLEEVIRPNMQAGEYPDAVLLATGREEALPETLIKEDGLEEITDVFDKTIPGEDGKVKDKLLDGFTDTLATNPYGGDKTYLAPMFYSPTGLFYNKALFEDKGWDVPQTWDDMWKLGDKAEKEDIALFTYPVAGYFDTFINSMLYNAGGPELFNSAMNYEKDVWKSQEATEVFDTVGKLKDYLQKNTVANANPNDFTKNQQLVLDNKALMMPNGNWVVDEMKDAPRADGFEWGMMPIPALKDGGDRYAYTFFEQMWIPKAAKNKDAAKDFIAYMYSDEAADIFLENGAVQPVEGITDKLDGQKKIFYSIYDDEGVLPAMGSFASTKPVAGVNIGDTLYKTIDSVMSGKKTVTQWQDDVEKASDKLRDAKN